MRRAVGLLAWVVLASLLAAAGFTALVYGSAAWLGAGAEGDAGVRLHAAFAVYFRVVLAKGLLPAVLGAVALWPLVDAGKRFTTRGARGIAVGIAIASLVASAAAAALLMPRAWPGLPAVVFQGPANFVQSSLELSVGVALALGLARALLGSRIAPAPSPSVPSALGARTLGR